MGSRHIKYFLISALFLISISSVMALGVNSPYWKDNPLKMYPGETRSVEFPLVNSISEKQDAKAIVSLIESGGIAEITSEKEFAVSPGSNDNRIIIRISVPKEAEIGKTYNIKFSIRSPDQEKEGNVQINVGYDVEFPVVVTDKSQISEKTSENRQSNTRFNKLAIIFILLLIGIILYFIHKKSKFK